MSYMNGYPDGTFGPDKTMTRAEVIAMLARLMVEPIKEGVVYTNTFSDVGNEWYSNAVGFMQGFGIINGYPDGSFRPDKKITREEFAKIATEFAELEETEENFFSDIEDSWTKEYILIAHKNGWVNGYPDGTFRPENYITRAEVVTLVNRMLERRCDKVYVKSNNIQVFKDISDAHWAFYNIIEASKGHLYRMSPEEVWVKTIENEK